MVVYVLIKSLLYKYMCTYTFQMAVYYVACLLVITGVVISAQINSLRVPPGALVEVGE